MRTTTHAIAFLLSVVSAVSVARAADSLDITSGYIERFAGVVFLRANADSKPVRLDAKRDYGRFLHPNEELRCQPCGTGPRVLLYPGQLVTLTGAWLKIQKPEAGKGKAADALDAFGKRLGAERAEASPFFLSPSEGSVVRAAKLVVAWRDGGPKTGMLLRLTGRNASEIGRHSIEHPSETRWTPSRQIRKKLREAGGAVSLSAQFESGEGYSVRFSVLSPDAEEQLGRDLADANSQHGLLRLALRWYAFNHFGLSGEALGECESALKRHPASVALAALTAEANARAGNMERARQLSSQTAGAP